MLSVAVDLDGDVEVVVPRVLVSSLDGTTDSKVERKAQDFSPVLGGHDRGAIGGAVVNHDHVQLRVGCANLCDHGADRVLLVQSRDDYDLPHAGGLSCPARRLAVYELLRHVP